uniref:immunity protein Imm33 domain-containing protein n=1 Tax=unclassified Variovorax TaxID=663243 RepID=UPI000D3473A3
MSLRSVFSLFGRKPPPSAPPRTPGVHTTSACKHHDHPEFQVRVSNSAVPEVDIALLLRFFEERVAQGEKFRSGESLQVGWMFTMLEDGPDGVLRVLEPDMKAVPVKFVDSVDGTLMHLRNQQDVVASLSPPVAPDFPSLRQSAAVHLNYRQASRVLLTRSAAVNETDSGWWLSDLDDEAGAQDPTRFMKTSLYQLGIDRPDLIKFFALPAELQVVVDGPHIHVLGAGGELQQMPGSYLSELNKLRQQRASSAARSFAG